MLQRFLEGKSFPRAQVARAGHARARAQVCVCVYATCLAVQVFEKFSATAPDFQETVLAQLPVYYYETEAGRGCCVVSVFCVVSAAFALCDFLS